jgi:hypothetical protein
MSETHDLGGSQHDLYNLWWSQFPAGQTPSALLFGIVVLLRYGISQPDPLKLMARYKAVSFPT